MATTTKQYQILQKQAAEDYLLLHPETDAEIVLLASEKITTTTVKEALEELKTLIDGITGGGVVTGIKGSAETAYRTGNVEITKANIDLDNVDNTADVDKPVSTAQQAELDKKIDKTSMGVANGVATLDASGLIPSSQLPSYVDDVLEYTNKASFPAEGEDGKIYVDTTTNLTYRWSGSAYVEISASLALGETSATAYAGDKGKANAEAIAALQTRAATIETKNGEQDAAISAAQTTADEAKTATETNKDTIDKIVDGTTQIGDAAKADKLSTARAISLSGDATGSATFDGSADKDIAVTLANTGITAGTYSAITVDAKGRATAGAQVVEIGAASQETASDSLAVGGLFFKQNII